MTSMTAGGRELRHAAIELGAGGIDDMVMRFTDAKLGQLSGVVTAVDGKPRQDVSVYVFPTDRARWSAPNTSGFSELRPDRIGAYHASLMPGEEFFVAAVAGHAQEFWMRPEFLESLAAFATKVTLDSAGQRVVNLTARDR